MKIVIAPDSFKGSATSSEIASWIAAGIHSVIPTCEIIKIAIASTALPAVWKYVAKRS